MKKTFVAASAALIVAGCGGSDGLTRKQAAKKANAICAKYAKQGADLGAPDLTDPESAETYFTKAEALTQKQQKELEALEPVESAKADFEKLTDATNGFTTLLGDLGDAAGKKDNKKGLELLRKLPEASEKVDAAAKTVGADTCAS